VQVNPARVRIRPNSLRLVASSSATRIRSPEFFAMLSPFDSESAAR
jgi:hypothetical protein